MKEYKGFKFPMGFFIVHDENGKMKFGKCDPVTKEVLESYEMCAECNVKEEWPPKII